MHYPDLGSASDWLCREGIFFRPIRSTTKIWVVYVSTSVWNFCACYPDVVCEGSSGDLAKRRLFSQAIKKVTISMMSLFLIQGCCTKDVPFSPTCRLNIFVSNLCYKYGAMKWSTANDLCKKIFTTDENVFPPR